MHMMLLDAWMMLMMMFLNFYPCGFKLWVVTGAPAGSGSDGAASVPGTNEE
jgi:hypothetical protein